MVPLVAKPGLKCELSFWTDRLAERHTHVKPVERVYGLPEDLLCRGTREGAYAQRIRQAKLRGALTDVSCDAVENVALARATAAVDSEKQWRRR